MATSELEIVNALRRWLPEKKFSILQLIAPGGQAPYSLFIPEHEDNNRLLIYPDLICYDESTLILGEVKPVFSKSDDRKLNQLIDNDAHEGRIRSLIQRITGQQHLNKDLEFWLIHSGASGSVGHPRIRQLIFMPDNTFQFVGAS